MSYTVIELLWIFFVYSFLGWVVETLFSHIVSRKLVNRGLVNGPLCIIYGVAGLFITVGLGDLIGIPLFVISAVLATVIEWIGGHLIEKMYHERWWDYSNVKWNLDGYICAPMSLAWGLFGFIGITWLNDWLLLVINIVPKTVSIIVVCILSGLLLLDLFATVYVLSDRTKYAEQMKQTDEWFDAINYKLTKWLCKKIDRRIKKAYPKAVSVEKVKEKSDAFAAGCSFYKIVLLFIIGAFLGDIVETIYCRIVAGYWMSRSSLVWGPFSIVWGLAIAMVTALLYKYKDSSDRFLFLTGAILGGTYEYLCSVFTEIVFGKIFWDYSWMPLNLGGRINLLYCFFWGIAGVVWFKVCYPRISGVIEKIPKKWGVLVTNLLIAFMAVNIMVSCTALIRYEQRDNGIVAEAQWQKIMDDRFPDDRMEKIYPNAMGV